ncbi:MAG TPA: amino acid racemase, partial [Candidatus Baltobacteraceae bacterium]|nr:amino acid racemase [Candidatus Baltobacteraceae bacterium]
MAKKIGILGGIGPEATGVFYLDLIERLQKSGRIRSNTDFPQILVNSINAPELVRGGELDAYVKGLKELDSAGVDFIVMVCNTVHAFYEDLQKEIKTPIIDLRKEVAGYLERNGVESVVLLATPVSLGMGLYKGYGVRYYELESHEVEALGSAVLNFNLALGREAQVAAVEGIARKYADKGAELVISGCTEIGLMLEGSGLNSLDTM